jgi:hypothetical protein
LPAQILTDNNGPFIIYKNVFSDVYFRTTSNTMIKLFALYRLCRFMMLLNTR